MSFHRADADAEPASNLTGALSATQQFEHLQFAIREMFQFGAAVGGWLAREPLNYRALHFWAEISFILQDLANRRHDDVRGLLFHDITARTGLQGAFRVKGFVVH